MAVATVSSADKLGLTFFMAGIVHALFILGISFEVDKARPVSKTLEIVLLTTPDTQRPEKADFLAQENQLGSGEAEEKALNKRRAAPRPAAKSQASNATKNQPAKAQPQHVFVQDQSTASIAAAEKEIKDERKPITSADLLRQSEEIARLQAEIIEQMDSYSRRPRVVRINSVNAHKHIAASYEAGWQRKVERVGNLNYPGEVRRKKLSGSLVLSVILKSTGKLKEVIVDHSSGHKIIDDAAVNIVKLAAPFAPFPLELQHEADLLVITRTWQFQNEGLLRTR